MQQTYWCYPVVLAQGNQANQNVVLNLTGIRYANSTVLEVLVNRVKRLTAEGRQLCLCCLSEELADVMSVHHLDRLFTIDQTEEAAIASVS